MITHRCEGSLNENVSIRRVQEPFINDGEKCWSIIHYELDNEWDCLVRQFVPNIKFCPYCGKELKVVNLGGLKK